MKRSRSAPEPTLLSQMTPFLRVMMIFSGVFGTALPLAATYFLITRKDAKIEARAGC